MALATQFLTNIRNSILALDGDRLEQFLQVEPSSANVDHARLRNELRQGFVSPAAIDKLVDKCLPEEDDPAPGTGSPYPSLVSFVKEFLRYWKNVDFDNLLSVHEMLSDLLTSCATALTHPAYGTIVFRTSVSLSESLCKVVMLLNRRPDLMRARQSASGEEDSKSMVESSADLLQKIFTSCLTDRSSARYARPEGKKVGVYIFANLVLKLLLTCGKSRLAAQLLLNISTSGPPLAYYPSSQRVTFLYHLGRFYFDCDNFVRSARCLEEAYLHTPPTYINHRRLILLYLVSAELLLGRVPQEYVLQRYEAQGFATKLRPLMQAVRKGDFVLLQMTIKQHEEWLHRRGLLLPFTYRLRSIVWRSLIRRVFVLTYQPPTATAAHHESSRAAATLSLADVLTAALWVQEEIVKKLGGIGTSSSSSQSQSLATTNGSANLASKPPPPPPSSTSSLAPTAVADALDLLPSQGLLYGTLRPSAPEIEGVISSLISQNLMHGFIAHSSGRFAIMGAKQRGGPLAAGWPIVATALMERLRDDGVVLEDVPGWVTAPDG